MKRVRKDSFESLAPEVPTLAGLGSRAAVVSTVSALP
jgi:hypothetical protein